MTTARRSARTILEEAHLRPLLTRVGAAGLWVVSTGAIGAAGYRFLSDGAWSWSDCLYMTVITISTVGFGETLHDMEHVAYARTWTMLLILFGTAGLLTFISSFTAFIVENDLGQAIARSRMTHRIDSLSKHCIVCGCGRTGEYVVRELVRTNAPFVIIERDEARLDHIRRELPGAILSLVGDATDDDVLRQAGLERASSVIAALHDDPSNLYVTLSARTIHPSVRIIAKAIDVSAQQKMIHAGADSVVLANMIGGTRMARETNRPRVVQFLDQVMQQHEIDLTELSLTEGHRLIGHTLATSDLRHHANALVLAVRAPDGTFLYNPDGTFLLREGMTLILVGAADKLAALQRG